MRTRELPREEWGRLDAPVSPLLASLPPGSATLLVVESEDGEIVGCTAVLQLTHLEGAWVHPNHRGRAGVGRALLRAVQKHLENGKRFVLAATDVSSVERALRRLGAHELPVSKGIKSFGLEG